MGVNCQIQSCNVYRNIFKDFFMIHVVLEYILFGRRVTHFGVNVIYMIFTAICLAGEEYVSYMKTCTECPLGSYKSEIGNNKACTRCAIGKTTEFTGSISVNNCSLRKLFNCVNEFYCTKCC